jgi:ureidoacrylate peracid hydrolase
MAEARMVTAVLLVDLQNAFCTPGGSYARRGQRVRGVRRLLANCLALTRLARTKGWPVIYTRLAFAADYHDAGLLALDRPAIRELGAYAEGTVDSAIVTALTPQPGDLVVTKTRYDPFVGTDLEGELRRRGIDRLAVAGLLTNVCVESTVRSAYDRGVRVFVVREATAAVSDRLQRASLDTLAAHFAEVGPLAALAKE